MRSDSKRQSDKVGSQVLEIISLDDFGDPLINIGELFDTVAQKLIVLDHTLEMHLASFEVIPQLDICIIYVLVPYHDLV